MKSFAVVAGLLGFFVGAVAFAQDKAAHSDKPGHMVVRPDAIKWAPAPPGLPPGSQMHVLSGDPGKAGPFVIRAKMPAGYKVPPHWHPGDENLTVLKGTLLVGTGDTLDKSKMEKMPAGSFVQMPKTMRHSVVANGETIIQVNGVGPFEISYVNPADDPRKKDTKKSAQ